MHVRALLLAGSLAWILAGCLGTESSPTPVEFLPPVECLGIPASTCQEIVTSARLSAPRGTVPVRIRAVCTQPPCTLQRGDVSIDVTYSDGSTQSSGMGWAGPGAGDPAPVAPNLPVEPTCIAVPVSPCRDRALEAVMANGDLGAIRAIAVRCTIAACTDTQGTGETLLTFADGSTSTSGWGYSSGG